MPDGFNNAHRAAIISAAARNNVPAVYTLSDFVKDGGLLSYGVDRVDLYRRAATSPTRRARPDSNQPATAVIKSERARLSVQEARDDDVRFYARRHAA
jgi:putative ABC transport system substrate-binding protein